MGGIERIHFVESEPQYLGENTRQYSEKTIPKLSCKNYGFDCSFITNGQDVEKIIKEFREHTLEEHYIDYPEGVLMKVITKNIISKSVHGN